MSDTFDKDLCESRRKELRTYVDGKFKELEMRLDKSDEAVELKATEAKNHYRAYLAIIGTFFTAVQVALHFWK